MKTQNINSKYLLLLFMLFIVGSCSKDLGNYDYKEKNTLGIMKPLLDEYVADRNTVLIIPVSITTSDGSDFTDTTRYAYEWQVEDYYGEHPTVLSRNYNFNAKPATLAVGVTPVQLFVLDKKTKATLFKTTNINLSTITKEGLYVLTDIGGKGRLDMVYFSAQDPVLYKDILASQNTGISLQDQGIPYSINTNGIHQLIISTDSKTISLLHNTLGELKWDGTYNMRDWFDGNPPNDLKVLDITTQSNYIRDYVVTNKGLYFGSAGSYRLTFGESINRYGQGNPTFNVAPFSAIAGWLTTFSFNSDAHCFLSIATAVQPLAGQRPYPTAVTQFKTSTGLVYSLPAQVSLVSMKALTFNTAAGLFSYPIVAILKDPATNQYLLMYLTSSGTILNTPGLVMNVPNFGNAENIAIDPTYGYVFYNVGNNIFAYDFNSNSSKLMLTTDKPISFLGFPKFSKINTGDRAPVVKSAKTLLVGTTDNALPAGANGILSMYTVLPSFQNITFERSLTGLGKIVGAAQLDIK